MNLNVCERCGSDELLVITSREYDIYVEKIDLVNFINLSDQFIEEVYVYLNSRKEKIEQHDPLSQIPFYCFETISKGLKVQCIIGSDLGRNTVVLLFKWYGKIINGKAKNRRKK